jgi:oligopeptidase B
MVLAMTSPSATPPIAPVAEQRPVSTVTHGHERTDEYGWLREKDSPEVIAHLELENSYTASVMASTAGLQQKIFEEIKNRVLETDLSIPTVKGTWAYFQRTEEGKQYGMHCRRLARPIDSELTPWPPLSPKPTDDEIVLLDENELAKGHDFFALGTFELSADHTHAAYAFDTDGDEIYELHIRNLMNGADLDDILEGTAPGVAWSTDGSVLFYLTLDETMRPWRVWRHAVGTPQSADVCVFEEPDERFFVSVGLSTTEDLLAITVNSQVTTEFRVLRANNPLGEFTVVAPRRQEIEYAIEHHRAVDGSERFFVVTNDGAEDFRLLVAPLTGDVSHWVPAGPEWEADELDGSGRPRERRPKLDAIEVFRSHLALHERVDGLERIRVIRLNDNGSLGDEHVIEQSEPVHSVWPAGNVRFDTSILRFGYTSMTTPSSVEDYDMNTRTRVLRKRQPVLGDFDPSLYVADRLWATAKDGERIPISVVRHRATPIDGSAPGLLYGYGSYEISIDPGFSIARLSLLDRGAVFAIAHIRGGGEMGRSWYLGGKYLNKRNTFDDFIACGEALIEQRYVSADRLVARGGSAGGLLMGAITNARPDLFVGIVAEVPFVDVVNTMLDDSLPLTAIEWEEWGNPNDPQYYEYMRSYAPYENVKAQTYPEMLVTAGLNDPRVSYWEPAKWVQRLRKATTGTQRVLLKTEMGAGHGGPSGRYDVWRDEAFVLAFILRCFGLAPQ